jgi:hypothetical protein
MSYYFIHTNGTTMAEQPPAPPSRQQTVAIATPFYWADEVLYERHWPDGTVDYGPGTYTIHDNTRRLSLPPPVPSLREALGLPSKTQEKKRQRQKKKNY